MTYIYCEACGVGSHSNVHTCPQCGMRASRSYDVAPRARRAWRARLRGELPYEDVESAVRESIYGWRSGTVEPCRGAQA